MAHRYSTALSHLILTGTAVYCLLQIKKEDWNFSHGTFGLTALNSVIGVWKWGNPHYGDKVYKIYRFISYLQSIFILPCVVATIWLTTSSYPEEVGYAHIAMSVISLVCYVLGKKRDGYFVDFITLVNVTSLGIISFLTANYYGVASAISYAFAHFIVQRDGDFNDSIPAQDLYNYSLCFFTYFALKAVGD